MVSFSYRALASGISKLIATDAKYRRALDPDTLAYFASSTDLKALWKQ